ASIRPKSPLQPDGCATSGGTTMQTARPEQESYLLRHWRGELSLPISYWVNGGLVAVGMNIIATLVEASGSAGAAVLYLAALIPVSIWQIVGIWRSADRRRDGWATAAKVFTAIGVIFGILALIRVAML